MADTHLGKLVSDGEAASHEDNRELPLAQISRLEGPPSLGEIITEKVLRLSGGLDP